MRRGAAIALASAAGAVVLAIVSAVAVGSDPHKRPDVSIEDAREVVRDLVADMSDLRYDGIKERPGIAAYVFSSPEFQAYVDVSDGHLTLLTYAKEWVDAAVKLDSDEAVKAVMDFLASIGSPTDGMAVTVESGTGGGYPGYTVFLQRTENGVDFPDYRVVEIDGANGSVISLVDVRRPVTAPLEARVSAEDAIKVASGFLHDEHIGNVHQMITFDVSGQQLQVWEISVLSDDPAVPGRVLYVDAFSGALRDPSK